MRWRDGGGGVFEFCSLGEVSLGGERDWGSCYVWRDGEAWDASFPWIQL